MCIALLVSTTVVQSQHFAAMASRALAVWVGILAITVAPHAHALTEPSPYLGHLTVGEAQLGTASCA